MSPAPLPPDETERLQELKSYAILDSAPDRAYDDLTELAAQICQTPMALVSLLDADRQWFKSKVGVDVQETHRDISFCAHTILQRGVFVIPDTTKDDRFKDNPIVVDGPKVKFYAGAPLVTSAGYPLGSLCVIDRRPRTLSERQIQNLQALARQVVSQLELGRAASQNAHLSRAARRLARQHAHEARRDPLTGLMNHASFARCVDRRIASARRGRRPDLGSSAVLLINLDHFKMINDGAGHAAGDAVLREIGRAIESGIRGPHQTYQPRPHDNVSRLGSDEFAVLLNGLRCPADAAIVADRILAEMRRPIRVAGVTNRMTASIGISPVEARHGCVEDVLREADTAMYAAKRAGRGRAVTFDAQMHNDAIRRVRLERDLQDAIDAAEEGRTGGLHLQYQPLVDVPTGTPSGFEALARWQHPTLGAIAPTEFIPIAEETGLIVRLGSWVFRESARQLAAWSAAHPDVFGRLSVNVNVARRQLVDSQLVPLAADVLASTGLTANRIKLEITESSIMENPQASGETLARLRALGFGLFMDDFGTGHSSLSCLQRFPLDGLKIDRSFIASLAEQDEAAPVVHAVLELARCFNLAVTAEGVETQPQWRALQRLGCDFAQGYLFARSLSPADAERFVIAAAASGLQGYLAAA